MDLGIFSLRLVHSITTLPKTLKLISARLPIEFVRAEVRRSFITTTVLEQRPWSHHKGATSRVRNGNQRYPMPLPTWAKKACQLLVVSVLMPPPTICWEAAQCQLCVT